MWGVHLSALFDSLQRQSEAKCGNTKFIFGDNPLSDSHGIQVWLMFLYVSLPHSETHVIAFFLILYKHKETLVILQLLFGVSGLQNRTSFVSESVLQPLCVVPCWVVPMSCLGWFTILWWDNYLLDLSVIFCKNCFIIYKKPFAREHACQCLISPLGKQIKLNLVKT